MTESTHLAGGCIDHMWIRSLPHIQANCSLYSPYYTARDHDAVLTTVIEEPQTETTS